MEDVFYQRAEFRASFEDSYRRVVESVSAELREKDSIINEQADMIESLNCRIISLSHKVADVRGIVDVMRTHVDSSKLQKVACNALAKLSNDYADDIRELDGINAIITAMKKHLGNLVLQQLACCTLVNLAMENSKNKNEIREKKGIPPIISAMAMHLHNAEMQMLACRALQTLCVGNPDNRISIQASGGISAIRTGMKAHSGREDVQEQALHAMRNLSNHDNDTYTEK